MDFICFFDLRQHGLGMELVWTWYGGKKTKKLIFLKIYSHYIMSDNLIRD